MNSEVEGSQASMVPKVEGLWKLAVNKTYYLVMADIRLGIQHLEEVTTNHID